MGDTTSVPHYPLLTPCINLEKEKLVIAQTDSLPKQVEEHATEINIVIDKPEKIYAGCDMLLHVSVSCASACNLCGDAIKVAEQNSTLAQTELTLFDGKVTASEIFTLRAPSDPGDYTWSVIYTPSHENVSTQHDSNSALFSFTVLPHKISLSAWDIPFPVVSGSTFTMKAGVKCSAGCDLSNKEIEICDQGNILLSSSKLESTPWKGTKALYWTEFELQAPKNEGLHKYELKFSQFNEGVLHEETRHSCSFRAARPPEHTVVVEVTKKYKRDPINKALVMLHSQGTSYRAYSNENGIAKINVPNATYSIVIVAQDYEDWGTNIDIVENTTINVEMFWHPET